MLVTKDDESSLPKMAGDYTVEIGMLKIDNDDANDGI